MNEIEIYTDGDSETKEPLELALECITDDWIDAGQCCHQTIIDLRDACRALLEEVTRRQKCECCLDEAES